MMNRKNPRFFIVTFLCVFLLLNQSSGQSTTFKSGTAIIDMGSATPTVQNSLKPYGLIYALLKNNHVPISCVINAGKVKDGIDFVYNGKSYKGGTFIVSADYISSDVTTVLNSWSNQGVLIDYTNSDLTVNVSYKINFVPKWAIDKNYGSIAVGFLNAAGIPSSAYTFKTPDLLGSCDDIFILPHADPTWNTHNNLYFWNKNEKGAIWAGCHAVSVLEGLSKDTTISGVPTTVKMNFLSTNGLLLFTDHNITTTPFSNFLPADPVAQFFNKTDNAQLNGSETVYLPKTGSAWNTGAKIITSSPNQMDVPSLSPGAAVENIYGRAFDDPARGYVAYQASHNFNGTSSDQIAAQRIFFNFSLFALNDKVPPIITAALSGQPSQLKAGSASATMTANVTGTGTGFTYQWNANVAGTFSNQTGASTTFTPSTSITSSTKCIITCTVTESCGRISFDSKTFTIIPQTPPLVSATIDKSIADGCTTATISFNVFDSNVDANAGARTLMSVTGLSSGTVITNTAGDITFTSTENFKGVTSGNYTITNDGGTTTSTGTINITVGTASLAPALTADAVSAALNTVTAINVLGNDKNNSSASDGSLLYIKDITGKPTKGYVYLNSNNTVSYLSKDSQTGTDQFSYLACNSSGYCSTGIVTVTLVDNCGAGKGQSDPSTTGVSTDFVASADAYVDGTTSPTNNTAINYGSANPLILSGVGTSTRKMLLNFGTLSTFSSSSILNKATLVLTTASVFSYDANTPAGTNGGVLGTFLSPLLKSWTENGVTYTTTDGTTSWTASGINNSTSDYTTTGQSSLPFVTGGSKSIGDTINADVTTLVQNWITTPSTNKGLLIRPYLGKTTVLSFYSKEEATNTAYRPKLTLQYYPCITTLTNFLPVLYPDAATTSSTLSVTISPLTNDANYYGNTNNITAVTVPAHGTATFTANSVVYTPSGNFVGTDTLTYTVTDASNGQTNKATIRIKVTRVAPTILGDVATTNSNTAKTIVVGANDADPQSPNTLSAPVIVTNPTNGTVSVSGNDIVYTPSTGFVGTDVFTYKRSGAADDVCTTALSATATVTVTVSNQPPVANNDNISTFSCAPVTIKLKDNDTDPENGFLTPTIVTNPTNGTLTANTDGTYTYTPNTNYVGGDSFTYTVKDPYNSVSNTATVTITISGAANPNTAPVAVADNDNTLVNQVLYTNVLANDSDPNNDAFTISITAAGLKAPSNGTIQLMPNKLVKYTPNSGFSGTDTYEYQITDTHPGCSGNGSLTAVGLVTIKVAPVSITLSGKVWNDADQSGTPTFTNINTNTETGTNGSGALNVYLVDNTNTIVDLSPVDIDGTYQLSNVPSGTSNLKLIVSNEVLAIGATLSVASLPSGYANTSPLTHALGTTDVNAMTGYDFGIYSNPVLSPGVIVGPANVCGTSATPGAFTSTTNASGGTVGATNYSYQWQSSTVADFSSAVTDIAGATGTTYTPSAPITVTTYYRRKVTTSLDAAKFSNIVTVTLSPKPTVAINPATAVIQVNGNIALTASGADTYSWLPNTNLSATNTATVTASPLTTTAYTVTGTVSATGCVNTATLTVTVINPGVVAGAQTNCGSFTATGFTSTSDASGATGITYQWQSSTTADFSASVTTIGGATATTYSPGSVTGTTYYRRVATFSATSFNSNIISVTINTKPTVAISPATAVIQLNGNIALTASGADTYTWSPSTNLSATNTATVTASPLTTTAYTVTGTVSATGCVNTATLTVTVIDPGTITGDESGCGSFTATGINSTSDASGATGISYSWQSSTAADFSSGVTTIAGATAVTYSPGSVTATTYYRRVATFGGSSFNSNIITKTVKTPLTTGVTAGSNSPVCVNGTISLSASGGVSYAWTGPNGFVSALQAPAISNAATVNAGTYTVTVTAANGCTATASALVVVNTLPTVTVTPTAATITTGDNVVLTASGAGIYSWSPATGLSVTNTAAVTASPSVTTTYTVIGVAAGTGCLKSTNVVVTVKNKVIDAVDDDFTATEINGAKGGTTATVLDNDKLNNIKADISLLNLSLTSNGGINGLAFDGTGALVVPANTFEGTYTITYSICEKAFPTNCDAATVLIKIGRGLSLTATAICKSDVPYIQYTVVPNFTPSTTSPVTLTWLNGDKTVLTAQPVATGQPLQAEILWPGAVLDSKGNPTDWPGWYFANGQWIQGADGYEKTRPDAYLVISVNPIDTIKVSYPPATPACNAAPPSVIVPIVPGTIGIDQTICDGSTPAALSSVTNASGGNNTISYQWQSSTDGTTFTDITGANTEGYAPPALSQKMYYRRAASASGNATAYSNTVTVTIVAKPQVTAIVGPCALQKDSIKTFSVPAALPAATNYVWTLPAGYSGSSTTNSIDVKAGTANGTITVTPYNGGCMGNTVSYQVAVIDYAKVTMTGIPVAASGNNNSAINITVTLYDASGNRINCSGGSAIIKLCDSNPGSFTSVVDNNDGSYTTSLTASANDLSICGTVGGIPIQQQAHVTFTGPQGSIKGNGPILATETPKLTFTMTAGRAPFTVIYKSAKSNKTDTVTNYTSGTELGVNLIPSTTLYTLVSIIDANGERRDNNFIRDTATIVVLAPKVIITLKADPPKQEKDSSWATQIHVTTKNIGDLDLTNSQARLSLNSVFPAPVTYVLDSVKVFGTTVVPNTGYDGVQNTDLFAKLNRQRSLINTPVINLYQSSFSNMAGMDQWSTAPQSPDGTVGGFELWANTGRSGTDQPNEKPTVVYDGHSVYMFGPQSSLPIGVEADITLWLHVKPNGYTQPFVMQAVALGTGSTQGATALATSLSNDDADVNVHPEVTKKGQPVPTVINLFPSAVIGASLSATAPVAQGNGSYNVTFSYNLANYGNLNLQSVNLYQNLLRSIGSPASFSLVTGVTTTGTLLANPGFNGTTDTSLLAAGSILGYQQSGTVQFTLNIVPNQLSAVYRLQAIASGYSEDLKTTVTDLSTDGVTPDPDGNNIPSEKIITEIIINTPVPPLVPGTIGIKTGPTTTAPSVSFCNTTAGVLIIPTGNNSGGLDTYQYQWQRSADNSSFTDIAGAEDSTYATGTVNTSVYYRRATISGNQVAYGNSVYVQIFALPAKPVITGTGNIIVGKGNITLTSSQGNTYLWSTSAATRSIVVADTGNYVVTITDANGCTATSTGYVVTALDPLKVADVQKILSKSAILQSDGTFLIGFTILASNLRPELLDSVMIKDDLTKVFPSTTQFQVIDIKASGKLIVNSLYNGNSQTDMLNNGSQLPGMQTDSVVMIVKVIPNGFSGVLNNVAIQTAKSPYGTFSVTSNDPVAGNGISVREPTKFAIPLIDIFIPSGFSPNHDGTNDLFVITRPYNTNIGLDVYNRWGNLVYKSGDYKNDWDGRGNQQGRLLGDDLPDGTYYYLVTATDKTTGAVRKFTGFITLKR